MDKVLMVENGLFSIKPNTGILGIMNPSFVALWWMLPGRMLQESDGLSFEEKKDRNGWYIKKGLSDQMMEYTGLWRQLELMVREILHLDTQFQVQKNFLLSVIPVVMPQIHWA